MMITSKLQSRDTLYLLDTVHVQDTGCSDSLSSSNYYPEL